MSQILDEEGGSLASFFSPSYPLPVSVNRYLREELMLGTITDFDPKPLRHTQTPPGQPQIITHCQNRVTGSFQQALKGDAAPGESSVSPESGTVSVPSSTFHPLYQSIQPLFAAPFASVPPLLPFIRVSETRLVRFPSVSSQIKKKIQ